MSEFDPKKLAGAENGGRLYDTITMGGSGGKYWGSFQMGKAAWTAAGGREEEFGQASTAWARYESVARAAWGQHGSEYGGWVLGAGGWNKLKSAAAAGQTLEESGQWQNISVQAGGIKNGLTPSSPASAAVAAFNNYYEGKGSAGGASSKFPEGGKAPDNAQGGGGQNINFTAGGNGEIGADGYGGGIIKLHLRVNTTIPARMIWTTEIVKTGNPPVETANQWFYVPAGYSYQGADTFISAANLSLIRVNRPLVCDTATTQDIVVYDSHGKKCKFEKKDNNVKLDCPQTQTFWALNPSGAKSSKLMTDSRVGLPYILSVDHGSGAFASKLMFIPLTMGGSR